MKRAALQAVAAQKPMSVAFGTVKSEKPLEISVEQKMTLKEEQLILSRHLKDHEVKVTLSWQSGAALSGDAAHAHAIGGEEKPLLVHGALEAGERVILVRLPGGQKYLVWDRMVE